MINKIYIKVPILKIRYFINSVDLMLFNQDFGALLIKNQQKITQNYVILVKNMKEIITQKE